MFFATTNRVSTTSTSTESTLVADILSSISIEDIDDSLLPKEFKEKHKSSFSTFTTSKFKPSNPRPPRPRGPPRSRKEDNTVAKVGKPRITIHYYFPSMQ